MKALRIAFVGTLCAGLLGAAPPQPPLRGFTPQSAERERTFESTFLDIPSAAGALENARLIGRRPHYAGSDGDHELALAMRDKLIEYGFDATLETTTVRVDTPNKLVLALYADGRLPIARSGGRKPLGPASRDFDLREVPEASDPATAGGEVSTPFNSGSGDGDVTAPLVYANRGLESDYETLAQAHVDVRNAVVLLRYGAQFRGLLAERAQTHGAAAVIFYSDPKDDGSARGAAYPNGPWRPLTAVQRGSVGTSVHIPTLPVSAAIARELLAALRGTSGPPEWAGALPVAYAVARGPGLVHLLVKLDRKATTLWNTVGRLRGRRDDRTVMLGAHRDAWVYGVGDNGAGITTLLETARGLGYLAKNGWRPERSIVIAGWDGEEIGLAGSRAYVREHAAELLGCLAYLNADENVTGPTFRAAAAAAIASTIVEVTRSVADPATNRTRLFDRWLAAERLRDARAAAPAVGVPGGGSDHEPFLSDAGIPVVENIGFGGPFGVYHSSYDTLNYATTWSDPGFALHRTAAQLYGLVAMRLADADVVPYEFAGYVPLLQSGLAMVTARVQRDRLDVDLSALRASIGRFALAARRLDPLVARAAVDRDASDRELAAARELDPLVYGVNGYGSRLFPGLDAALTSKSMPEIDAALIRTAGAIARAASLLLI